MVCVCVSWGKKCFFFEQCGVLCFTVTTVLRFAFLLSYQRILVLKWGQSFVVKIIWGSNTSVALTIFVSQLYVLLSGSCVNCNIHNGFYFLFAIYMIFLWLPCSWIVGTNFRDVNLMYQSDRSIETIIWLS